MKTIRVVFTDTKLNQNQLTGKRRYAFNTENDFEVGDMIGSPNYNSSLQVVEILDKLYLCFNYKDGALYEKDNANKTLGKVVELQINSLNGMAL